ncbi:MAG: helix-turn-helix transcriptional regulator [Bacteroidales bacterium]|nr:helix-turn-helix transcriptional regulator [Bacteroidales bacterium]
MTPISLIYLLLGLSALVWPLALLLLKPRVLDAQWLLAVAILLMGLSFVVYSCFFNSFLSGEYLLVILFMLFALFTPTALALAITHLTRPQGVRRLSRALFLIPLATIALLALSVIIGGPDMYRLWIYRGTALEADLFYPNSWRYNLIVAIHFYLFYIVLLVQLVMLVVHTFRSLRRYRRTLGEYYSSSQYQPRDLQLIFLSILAISAVIILSLALFPFNAPRPFGLTLILAILQAVATTTLGLATYRLSHAAENIRYSLEHSPRTSRPRDLAALGRQLSQHIEKQAFLDPDLSVFSLANTFHISQDQVVDAIHRVHGQPFADYIDSLRIQHAITLLNEKDDPDHLLHIAHLCGYPDLQTLQRAYRKIMKTELPV